MGIPSYSIGEVPEVYSVKDGSHPDGHAEARSGANTVEAFSHLLLKRTTLKIIIYQSHAKASQMNKVLNFIARLWRRLKPEEETVSKERERLLKLQKKKKELEELRKLK